MRTIARLLLLALLGALLALAAPAGAQNQDAVAVNEKDGKSVFKLAFSVKKVNGDVDATNTAVAYASCTDCKTVAAAIQVVLVSGDPDSVEAQNVAVSINYDCTECDTLAAAFQFVYGDGQELEFTTEGKAKLHELKKRFKELKHRDDLTLAQLAAAIAEIADEVAVVVAEETQVKKAEPPPEPAATSTTGAPASSTTVAPSASTTAPPTTSSTMASSTSTTAPTSTTAAPTSTTTAP